LRSLPDGVDVRWYLNDASLQGQFTDRIEFERMLRCLIAARARHAVIRQGLRLTRSFPEAMVASGTSVRRALVKLRDKDLRTATLSWLDKTGPFIDDDRFVEIYDYFEYRDIDVTSTGLGEAARRTKVGEECATYSFVGGEVNFAVNPLEVDHGMSGDRHGRYSVANLWETDALVGQALAEGAPIQTWRALIETARIRFPNLEIGDLHTNSALAREPFDVALRDRSLELMRVLNDYVGDRTDDGVEGSVARAIVENHFTGDRAWFTGESTSNQNVFRNDLIFDRLSGGNYFAHWHGKISHRFFRMHIEWPLEKNRSRLEIFYLGPKITKS
jgi:hypothetical protein